PAAAAVARTEERRILHAGVDDVRVTDRRLEMPDTRELPGVRRAVVPEVRAGGAIVREAVAHLLPGPAAIVGSLDQLAEPARARRGPETVHVGGRSFEVVDLPPSEQRPLDVPALAPRICREHERAF